MGSLRLPYGPAPQQFGELRVPQGKAKHPVVIVLHGGFWRNKYRLNLMDSLCESLELMGVASWNLEYRSIGDPGGGWPGTCQDVASGASYLRMIADAHHLDVSNTLAMGHSAGGHLALWLASRQKLKAAIGLGAVADLQRALDLKLSDSVVAKFLNGAPLRDADPKQLLPLHAKLRLVPWQERRYRTHRNCGVVYLFGEGGR